MPPPRGAIASNAEPSLCRMRMVYGTSLDTGTARDMLTLGQASRPRVGSWSGCPACARRVLLQARRGSRGAHSRAHSRAPRRTWSRSTQSGAVLAPSPTRSQSIDGPVPAENGRDAPTLARCGRHRLRRPPGDSPRDGPRRRWRPRPVHLVGRRAGPSSGGGSSLATASMSISRNGSPAALSSSRSAERSSKRARRTTTPSTPAGNSGVVATPGAASVFR